MSVLHVIQQGLLTAAELAALLFIAPAAAVEAAPAARSAGAPIQDARAAHVASTAFDLSLLGTLAELRWIHTVENLGERPLDLAAWLPGADESIDALRITRGAHTVDLLAAVDGCGADVDERGDHATLERDEAIADALQLSRGEVARIEIGAVLVLEDRGRVYRAAAPAVPATLATYALSTVGSAPILTVLTPAGAAGIGRLTLRPVEGPAEIIELGRIEAGTAMFIVPLDAQSNLAALARGAVELEVRSAEAVHWTTLALRNSSPSAAPVLASAPR
jgi:hypothetical protein